MEIGVYLKSNTINDFISRRFVKGTYTAGRTPYDSIIIKKVAFKFDILGKRP